MDNQTRNNIRFLTNELEQQLDGVDFGKTFHAKFVCSIADNLVAQLMLPYNEAVIIATCIKIDSKQIIEDAEDDALVAELGYLFSHLIVNLTKSFFDNGAYDIEVMKNIANQMNITI